MKKKRITSTIILSIILIILLLFVLPNLTLNLHEAFENMKSDTSIEEYGPMAILVVAIGALGMLFAIAIYCMLFAAAATAAGVCLIFTIRNRKSCLKPIRIINYVLDGGFAFVIVASVTKIILFLCGH